MWVSGCHSRGLDCVGGPSETFIAAAPKVFFQPWGVRRNSSKGSTDTAWSYSSPRPAPPLQVSVIL